MYHVSRASLTWSKLSCSDRDAGKAQKALCHGPVQMYSCVPSSDTCEHFQASDEREQDIGLGQWW